MRSRATGVNSRFMFECVHKNWCYKRHKISQNNFHKIPCLCTWGRQKKSCDSNEAARTPKVSTGGDRWIHVVPGSLNNQCALTSGQIPHVLQKCCVTVVTLVKLMLFFKNWNPRICPCRPKWAHVRIPLPPFTPQGSIEKSSTNSWENRWRISEKRLSWAVPQKNQSVLRLQLITYRLKKRTAGSGTSIDCHS